MSGHVYTKTVNEHVYQFWSVTSIIGLFNELGLLQDKAYFRPGMSLEVGSKSDEIITQICNGKPVLTDQWAALPPMVQTAVLAWMRWHDKTSFKPRHVQYEVYSLRYAYAGTLDAIGFANGILGLYDWKTGICRPEMLRLQLVLYLFAYLEMHPRRVIRQLRGVYLDKLTGEFSEVIITIEEANEIFKQFLELREQIDYKTLESWGGLTGLKFKNKKYNGGSITMAETALVKKTPEALALQVRRDQVVSDLKIFYKGAPEPEIIKAAMLISYHGYSPENVYLIPFENKKSGTTDWATVVGIKGKRESVAAGGGRGLDYTLGTDCFPRIMTPDEKIRAFGKNDTSKVSAVCRIADTLGNVVIGYGHYIKNGSPKGMEKGNSVENMAMIRAEAQALGKLPNVHQRGQAPDVEVINDQYIEGDYRSVADAINSDVDNQTQKVFQPPSAQPQAQNATVGEDPPGEECPIHAGHFFQEKGNGKSKWLAHPIEDDDRFPKGWCNKTKADKLAEEVEKVVTFDPEDIDFDTGEVVEGEIAAIDYSDDDTFKDILRTCLVNLGWADEVNKKYNLAKLNQFIVDTGMFPNVKTFKEVSVPQRSTLIERLQQEARG